MRSEGKPKSRSADVITTAAELHQLCNEWSGLDQLGFDAEFVAEEGYSPDVCLVQVVTDAGVSLIDPMQGLNLAPFWELLNQERIQIVVHAGLEDLAIGFHQTGKPPRNVFDVQIAAGLVGFEYPLSLMRLARSLVGARLHKTQTLTDWRKRPLSPEQLHYAVEDVAYLLPIHAKLTEKLVRMDRVAWAQEEFARFANPLTYRQEETELFRRVKGVGGLDRRGLAIMRELSIEREALARRYNRPSRAVLKDHLMIAIARHGMAGRDELRSLRGLNLRSEAIDQVVAAVQRGLNTPQNEQPAAFDADNDTDQESTLRKLISAVLTDFCETHAIAHQLLFTNKDVRALVLSHTRPSEPPPPGALQRGWRKTAIGELVDGVLSGRRTIRVVRGDSGPRLTIE